MSENKTIKMKPELKLQDIEVEVFEMVQTLNQWAVNINSVDLSDVYVGISRFRSRCFEFKIILMKHRNNPVCTRFATYTLDPFLDELTEQFKIWSRIGSVRQLNWDMTKG